MIYFITMAISVCAYIWVYASINTSNVTPFSRNWAFNNQTSATLLKKRWQVDPWSTQSTLICAKLIFQLPCHCQDPKYETKNSALRFMNSLVPWWMLIEGETPPSTNEYHVGLILPLPLETGALALNWSTAPGTLKSVDKLAFGCPPPYASSFYL